MWLWCSALSSVMLTRCSGWIWAPHHSPPPLFFFNCWMISQHLCDNAAEGTPPLSLSAPPPIALVGTSLDFGRSFYDFIWFILKAQRPNFISIYSTARIMAIFHSQQVIDWKDGGKITLSYLWCTALFSYAVPIAACALFAASGLQLGSISNLCASLFYTNKKECPLGFLLSRPQRGWALAAPRCSVNAACQCLVTSLMRFYLLP